MRKSLRAQLIVAIVALAIIPLLVVGYDTGRRTLETQRQQAISLQQEIVRRVANEVETFIFAREEELRLLVDVQGLRTLETDQQRALLRSLARRQDVYSEIFLIDETGQTVVFESPITLSAQGTTASYVESAIFGIPRGSGRTYYSSVQIDNETGEPFMTIAIPLIDLATNEFDGVLAANFRFRPMWTLMEDIRSEINGLVYVVDNNNRVVAHPNRSVVLQGTRASLPSSDGFAVGLDGDDVVLAQRSLSMGLSSTLRPQSFTVVAELPESEALALANSLVFRTGNAIIAAAVIAGLVGTFIALRITGPIKEMAQKAEAISAGDLSQEVTVSRKDEIGSLGHAFNSMTRQLQELIGSLEQRVADRTRALETSVEVSRHLSTILEQETLVREVVEEVRAAFNYYHVHIYVYDDTYETLQVVGGTGEAGMAMLNKGHQIPAGKGLVGRAAVENEPVLIPDVTQNPDWLPNPLLPETKAEAAVPIALGDHVLGVLDVQQNVVNGLTEEDVQLLQSVAAQIAIALQNARAYEQAQAQADREAVVNTISQRIQAAADIESVLQIAAQELGQVLQTRRTIVQIGRTVGENGRATHTDNGHS